MYNVIQTTLVITLLHKRLDSSLSNCAAHVYTTCDDTPTCIA